MLSTLEAHSEEYTRDLKFRSQLEALQIEGDGSLAKHNQASYLI